MLERARARAAEEGIDNVEFVHADAQDHAFAADSDVMISRLRRRLGDAGREPEIIKTVRNEGYVLTGKVERSA